MDDAVLVGVVHGPGEQLDEPGRLAGRPRVPGQVLGQAAAVHELQGEVRVAVRLADLEDLHDVLVLQRRDRLGLAPEPLPLGRPGVRPGQDHLQRDGAVEGELPGLVDDAHPAAADLPDDLVAGDQRRGEIDRRHVRRAWAGAELDLRRVRTRHPGQRGERRFVGPPFGREGPGEVAGRRGRGPVAGDDEQPGLFRGLGRSAGDRGRVPADRARLGAARRSGGGPGVAAGAAANADHAGTSGGTVYRSIIGVWRRDASWAGRLSSPLNDSDPRIVRPLPTCPSGGYSSAGISFSSAKGNERPARLQPRIAYRVRHIAEILANGPA